jgi:hypothetical protein
MRDCPSGWAQLLTSSARFLPLFLGASVWYVSTFDLTGASDIYFVGIFTCKCDIYGHRCLPFGKDPLLLEADHSHIEDL